MTRGGQKREARDIQARLGCGYQQAHNLVRALGYEHVSDAIDGGATLVALQNRAADKERAEP